LSNAKRKYFLFERLIVCAFVADGH